MISINLDSSSFQQHEKCVSAAPFTTASNASSASTTKRIGPDTRDATRGRSLSRVTTVEPNLRENPPLLPTRGLILVRSLSDARSADASLLGAPIFEVIGECTVEKNPSAATFAERSWRTSQVSSTTKWCILVKGYMVARNAGSNSFSSQIL